MKPRLLVRAPSWLGDLVAAEPTLRALHADYAAHGAHGAVERLSIAGPAHLLPILDGALEGARRIPHQGRGGETADAWRGHDVALLLTGSFRSAWTALRAGIPRRVGWARDGRTLLLTDAMSPARERGRAPLTIGRVGKRPRYLPRPYGAACVELAGLLGVRVADPRPRLSPSPGAVRSARAQRAALGIDGDEPFLLVNAGARPGSAKGYPPELWGAVISHVAGERDLPALVVAGPGEEAAARATVAAAGTARAFAVIDPVCDLSELAAHAADSELVLTADAGPRHVANAAGADLVVVCGPTDPRHTAEHLERTTLLREPVDCGPCHRERCPLAGPRELACMRGIGPERIARAALDRLSV